MRKKVKKVYILKEITIFKKTINNMLIYNTICIYINLKYKIK